MKGKKNFIEKKTEKKVTSFKILFKVQTNPIPKK